MTACGILPDGRIIRQRRFVDAFVMSLADPRSAGERPRQGKRRTGCDLLLGRRPFLIAGGYRASDSIAADRALVEATALTQGRY